MRYWPPRDKVERTRGKKWQRMRTVVLIEEPVCRACERKPSEEVDHIIPVSKCPPGMDPDERNNLQGLCKDCHDEKTRKDLGIRRRPQKIGLDGYPIVTKDSTTT